MADEVKCCTKCLRELPIDRFALTMRVPGSRRSQCKQCRAAYFRKWRRDNPELQRQISRDNYAKFKELPFETRKMLKAKYAESVERNRQRRIRDAVFADASNIKPT